MLSLGSLSFAAPWALLGLVALPVVWWLLRVTPPAPRRVAFPPLRLLLGLVAREDSVAHTPWWLVALRVLLVALVVLAAAHPLIDVGAALRGQGPVILVVDNGWAAARDWPARQALLDEVIERAQREGRGVVLVPTAPPLPDTARILRPAEARALAKAIEPRPWSTDRTAAMGLLEPFRDGAPGQVFWLSDGLADGDTDTVVQALRLLAPLTVVTDPPSRPALLLRPPSTLGEAGVLSLERDDDRPRLETGVLARDAEGRVLGRGAVTFEPGARAADTTLILPSELLDRLVRLEMEGPLTAGGVVLVDARWRRRPVGLVATGTQADKPFLGSLYYLERALEPFAETRRGAVKDLLSRELAVLVLSLAAPLPPVDADLVTGWMESGGVVLRFAGIGMTESIEDPLLPVALRAADRALGGALAWTQPARLAPFDKTSPFAGLAIPEDVRIRRQVLARPSLDLADRTWARLEDGTPLVTFERRGLGWLVLVHVPADPLWSNLPLSGLFVDMLRRMIDLSGGGVSQERQAPLPPLASLDGFGRLGPPLAGARAIDPPGPVPVGPDHPPGFYGNGGERRALNLSASTPPLAALGALPLGVDRDTYGERREIDPRPWIIGAALLLLALDLAIGLGPRGLLRRSRASLFLLLLLPLVTTVAMAPFPTRAEVPPAALLTRLAYVRTGEARIDATSQAGLAGLGMMVGRRTAALLGEPVGVDPESDELAFYSLLYWPVDDGAEPSPAALSRVNAFMASGGTVLMDTREPGRPVPAWARGLEVPDLVPVPADHVLGRAFYLLQEQPGRWTGSRVWLDRPEEYVNDGVPRLVVGGNDWAGAWAVDEAERPLFPVVPGGERQRELAYRFGVNLVMVTLTGNYKADQVHLGAILQRLEK